MGMTHQEIEAFLKIIDVNNRDNADAKDNFNYGKARDLVNGTSAADLVAAGAKEQANLNLITAQDYKRNHEFKGESACVILDKMVCDAEKIVGLIGKKMEHMAKEREKAWCDAYDRYESTKVDVKSR